MISTSPLLDSVMLPIQNFLTINEYDAIPNALKLMRESFHKNSAWQGPHVLIVLNDPGQPVGLLTLKSLLRSAQIKQLEEDTNYKSDYVSWYYIKECHKNGILVREVMRPIKIHTIDRQNFDLNAVSALFARSGMNYIPVLDKDVVIGIADRSRVFYEIQSLNPLPNNLRFKILANYFQDIKTSLSLIISGIFPQ